MNKSGHMESEGRSSIKQVPITSSSSIQISCGRNSFSVEKNAMFNSSYDKNDFEISDN